MHKKLKQIEITYALADVSPLRRRPKGAPSELGGPVALWNPSGKSLPPKISICFYKPSRLVMPGVLLY
jgi:hypothetical protein